MSIDNIIRNGVYNAGAVARPLLNMQFPKEFELYVMAFELVNGKNETIRYFIFPTMPSAIEETYSPITNIKKTYGGVTALKNTSFVPRDISLSGTFGRKFRVLLGSSYVDLVHSFKSIKSLKNGLDAVEELDIKAKTGFGCIKILESIIEESSKVDENGPRKLFFYNLALGNNYLVEPITFKQTQSQESNMIWNYTLQLKAIAPLDLVLKNANKKRQELIITGFAQQKTNQLVGSLTKIVASGGDVIINSIRNGIR